MLKSISTFLFSVVSMFSHCQSNTISSGAHVVGAGSVTYTIGQTDFSNQTNSVLSINQGVQQPFEIYFLEVIELENNGIYVYPNPTKSSIRVEGNISESVIHFSITSLDGKTLSEKVLDESRIIDLSEFDSSIYLLNLFRDQKLVQILRISKQ